jgi:epoxyqueuosine reductase
MEAEELIAQEARALGFPLAGCAPIAELPRARFLASWLADGRAGEMRYLERRPEQRLDPRQAWPWARAIVTLAFPYRPPPPPPSDWRATLRGRIAAYAAGRDYHDRVGTLLDRLIDRLRARWPRATFRPYVDTGPMLEREWAMRARLGWIGRNTLLLHRHGGSYFFLAEVLTDLVLAGAPLPADHCGTCTRCLTGCPTGALTDYAMDPRRCISYLTIEHRTAIPLALRPALENWVFGCDVCQEVCPWNRDARGEPDAALTPFLPEVLALDAAAFRARFGGTAVTRTRRRGLLRNVAVALGNSGNPDAVPPLVAALADPEPLVRGHAAWALGRLGGRAARDALERTRRADTDPDVRAEADAARAAADPRLRLGSERMAGVSRP